MDEGGASQTFSINFFDFLLKVEYVRNYAIVLIISLLCINFSCFYDPITSGPAHRDKNQFLRD